MAHSASIEHPQSLEAAFKWQLFLSKFLIHVSHKAMAIWLGEALSWKALYLVT